MNAQTRGQGHRKPEPRHAKRLWKAPLNAFRHRSTRLTQARIRLRSAQKFLEPLVFVVVDWAPAPWAEAIKVKGLFTIHQIHRDPH